MSGVLPDVQVGQVWRPTKPGVASRSISEVEWEPILASSPGPMVRYLALPDGARPMRHGRMSLLGFLIWAKRTGARPVTS